MTNWPEEDDERSIYRIEEPEFDSVDVVTAGDNPHAKIVFWKSASEDDEDELSVEEIDEIAMSAIDEVAKESLAKMRTRGDTQRELDEIADRIAKSAPSLTPAEAYRQAMGSEMGRDIRKRREELGPDHVRQAPAPRRTVRPVVKRMQERAEEIRKDAALAGEPISEAEAYKRAMLER